MSKEKSTYLPGFVDVKSFNSGSIVPNKPLKFSFVEINLNVSALLEILKQSPELVTKREYKGELSKFTTIKLIPSTSEDAKSPLFGIIEKPWNPKSGSKNSKKKDKKKKKKGKK